MAHTGTELIDLGLSHLGARDSGQIGSKSVNDAARDSLNNALTSIAKEYDHPALQRVLSIDVSESAYQYSLPVLDDDDETIRIRNLVTSPRLLRDGDTYDFRIDRITQWSRERHLSTQNTDRQQQPRFYTIFNSKIELWPYPEDDYTLRMLVNIWPTAYTDANLTSEHEFGVEFDMPLEYFMCWELFMKLQQPEEAAGWRVLYSRSLRDTVQSLEKHNDLVMPNRRSVLHKNLHWFGVDELSAGVGTYRNLDTGQVT